ncbi:hypothetical protein JDV09_17915 [Mycobacterium sp. Y57]|uniref:hypothetical protein n=1 Tax=Mycolicibacterium xanthum TaxID=2796469 RepID=UPI001C85DA8C|nr:hypothetical protein [Mycolicibacterium xanthum]MBX7433973.1 hypothetical protein [Mycolicibacterium xanthum]
MNVGKVWGDQYPFERNHLQRTMTLLGLIGVLAVTVIILVHANITGLLGISLIGAGCLSALAAVSRHRYVRETRLGFEILRSRGGRFVLGSGLAFAVVGALVAFLILLG